MEGRRMAKGILKLKRKKIIYSIFKATCPAVEGHPISQEERAFVIMSGYFMCFKIEEIVVLPGVFSLPRRLKKAPHTIRQHEKM